MTPPELDEARALLAGITPGEWVAEINNAGELVIDLSHDPDSTAVIWCGDMEASTGRDHSNHEFIARAPSLLRWAVARIDALEHQVRLLSTPFADVMAELGLTDADLDGDEGDDEAR